MGFHLLHYEGRGATLDHDVLLVVDMLDLILLDHLDLLDDLQSVGLLLIGYQIDATESARTQCCHLLQIRDGNVSVCVVELGALIARSSIGVAQFAGLLAELAYGAQVANEGPGKRIRRLAG